jgi:hypothetical protein
VEERETHNHGNGARGHERESESTRSRMQVQCQAREEKQTDEWRKSLKSPVWNEVNKVVDLVVHVGIGLIGNSRKCPI